MRDVELNAECLKKRMAATVARLKSDLRPWLTQHTWPDAVPSEGCYPAYYELVTAALLETAVERYVAAHGSAGAAELMMGCFHRQTKTMGHPAQ